MRQELESRPRRIAVVLSAVNVRRLAPGFAPFAGLGYDFWIIDIYRPREILLRALKEWEPSAIITEWIPELTEFLAEFPCPMVVVPADLRVAGAQCVDVDDEAVGRVAAEHLRSRGYREFAFVGRGDAHYAGQRKAGFQAALGRPVPVFWEAFSHWRQYDEYWREPLEELSTWLKSLPSPVGIFAAHDPTARHVLEAAAQIGREAPYSIGLVSANDDETVCAMARPAISSIRLPWRRLAGEAVHAVERLWRGEAPGQAVLAPPLEVAPRGSSAYEAVEDERVRRALLHLQSRTGEILTVAELAREVGVSRRVLERRFRETLGRSPLEVITRERIERAKRLLADTDLPIALIAERCGFQSNERLTVNFGRLVGIPPSAYRRRTAAFQ
jgi:LacI family transcriptional regulator